MNTELTVLLNYENPSVNRYFSYHYPSYTQEEAQVLFSDLLAWMWLNRQRAQNGKKTRMFGPLLVLDELWHVFILHSRDYLDFSIRFFGDYFHHDIEPLGEEHMMEEDELRDYLNDCFEYLGKEWVERRFALAVT